MEQMHLPLGTGLPFRDLSRRGRPEPKHRLLLAVVPDDEAQLRIGAEAWRLHNQLGLRGRPFEIGRFQLTLFSLGDFPALPERTVAAAKRAVNAVAARGFDLCLDRVMSFRRKEGPQPLVMLGDEGLYGFQRLQDGLAPALRAAGLETHAGGPHLTLLLDHQSVPEMPVRAVRFPVREVVLLDTRPGLGRDATLARWPLLG